MLIALSLCVGLTVGCEQDRKAACDSQDRKAEISGKFDVHYDSGFVGRIPIKGVPMFVSGTPTGFGADGCGYPNDDWWWVDLVIVFPATVECPSVFDESLGQQTYALAAMKRCPDGGGDCRRSLFDTKNNADTAFGQIDAFDPVQGLFRGWIQIDSYSGVDGLDGPPRDTIRFDMDFTWEPTYVPILTEPMDGRWLIESTEILEGTEEYVQRLELSQDGVRLTATLCDEEWNCVESDFAGVVTDPRVDADWTVEEETYSLRADLEPGGNSFVGTVGSFVERVPPYTGYWEIRGERVD